MKALALPEKPILHKVTPKVREWQKKVLAEASAQPESGKGELIEFWLLPEGQTGFNGQEILTSEEMEPLGPYVVCDPRCNHGTLTDEEVFEYVLMNFNQPPLMFTREPWGDEENENEQEE